MKYSNPAPAKNPGDQVSSPAATAASRLQKMREQNPEPVAANKGGFDPYNSGAFDRRHTWEKVVRK